MDKMLLPRYVIYYDELNPKFKLVDHTIIGHQSVRVTYSAFHFKASIAALFKMKHM